MLQTDVCTKRRRDQRANPNRAICGKSSYKSSCSEIPPRVDQIEHQIPRTSQPQPTEFFLVARSHLHRTTSSLESCQRLTRRQRSYEPFRHGLDTMRPGKGCSSCRERHLKCVTEPGNASCTRCLEAERECTFGPKYRFKQVAYVDGPSKGSKGGRQDLSYDKDQVWVSTRKHRESVELEVYGMDWLTRM